MPRAPLACLLLLLPAACSSPEPAGGASPPVRYELTIDYLAWSDELFDSEDFASIGLLGHLRDWDAPPTLKEFTACADDLFYLESADHRAMARTGIGGVTSGAHGRFVVLRVLGRGLLPGHSYTLRPRNQAADCRWAVADAVAIER